MKQQNICHSVELVPSGQNVWELQLLKGVVHRKKDFNPANDTLNLRRIVPKQGDYVFIEAH